MRKPGQECIPGKSEKKKKKNQKLVLQYKLTICI